MNLAHALQTIVSVQDPVDFTAQLRLEAQEAI
jgi:hypothetical protein